MAKNVGKVFEQNFKSSVPDDIWCYKPPDAAQAFGGNNNLRFSAKSLCDYMLFNGTTLFGFELKSFEGSCSFERDYTEHGIIHWYQIKSLEKMAQYKNIISGFILDFRKSDETFFIDINDFNTLISHINKKSFNVDDLKKYGNPILINKKKLKVNYRYEVGTLLSTIEERNEKEI